MKTIKNTGKDHCNYNSIINSNDPDLIKYLVKELIKSRDNEVRIANRFIAYLKKQIK